jgi:hypothetical protein
MALLRYAVYMIGIAGFTWLLTWMEIAAPGSLLFYVNEEGGSGLGTSEYSPVEIIQPVMLAICGLLFAWVARDCPSQRPIAFAFGGFALVAIVRELDYFFDRLVADNFWQVLVAIIAALAIAYTYRHRKRFRIAWLRLWPSPGLTLIFAGATIHFGFALAVGHEPFWVAIMGEDYQRVVKLAVEEMIELMGYYLWLIGSLEYAFHARAIAFREPQPAVAKRRAGRKPKSKGRF